MSLADDVYHISTAPRKYPWICACVRKCLCVRWYISAQAHLCSCTQTGLVLFVCMYVCVHMDVSVINEDALGPQHMWKAMYVCVYNILLYNIYVHTYIHTYKYIYILISSCIWPFLFGAIIGGRKGDSRSWLRGTNIAQGTYAYVSPCMCLTWNKDSRMQVQ